MRHTHLARRLLNGLVRVVQQPSRLALLLLQLPVVDALLARGERLARRALRVAAQLADLMVDAQLLARAEHADFGPVDRAAELLHDLLQLRVGARRVDDTRQPYAAAANRRAAEQAGAAPPPAKRNWCLPRLV